jgi:hypothetical protein
MSQKCESNASEEKNELLFRLGIMFLYKAPILVFLNKNFSKQT